MPVHAGSPTVTWQSSVGPSAMSVSGPDERMCCWAAAGPAATNANTDAQTTARRSVQNISTILPRKRPSSQAQRRERPPCSHAYGRRAICQSHRRRRAAQRRAGSALRRSAFAETQRRRRRYRVPCRHKRRLTRRRVIGAIALACMAQRVLGAVDSVEIAGGGGGEKGKGEGGGDLGTSRTLDPACAMDEQQQTPSAERSFYEAQANAR